MIDDDLPAKGHELEETAAGVFGQVIGAGVWIALFLALAGAALYFFLRVHGSTV